MTTFQEKVRGIVRKIPAGSVLTYTDIAKAAGNPKAARAVANVMAKNFNPTIPCHRVIRSDGRPGGYNRGGESAKRRLLEAEGVVLLLDE